MAVSEQAPRILIIDDDRAFRIATRALLTDEGYEVDAASGGDEGLARLQEGRYQLVLLDLKMEGRSGLSVLEELRRSGHTLPVLMLTGYATVDSAVQALKLGADDYLTKPCDNQLLRSKIRSILATRPMDCSTSRISGPLATIRSEPAGVAGARVARMLRIFERRS